MTVTVIPIVVDALGTVPLSQQIREKIETIQTTALFTSARILRRAQDTYGKLLSLRLPLEKLLKLA